MPAHLVLRCEEEGPAVQRALLGQRAQRSRQVRPALQHSAAGAASLSAAAVPILCHAGEAMLRLRCT